MPIGLARYGRRPTVTGGLDIVLFEGWRVGVDRGQLLDAQGEVLSEFDYSYTRGGGEGGDEGWAHATLNDDIDFLMYLDANLDDVFRWKRKSSIEDFARAQLARGTADTWTV